MHDTLLNNRTPPAVRPECSSALCVNMREVRSSRPLMTRIGADGEIPSVVCWDSSSAFICEILGKPGLCSDNAALISYPAGKEGRHEILEGTTEITYEAFWGATKLTSVAIPDSVTSIGDNAFFGCTGLTGIDIPQSVTSVSRSAFDGCSSLTTITVDTLNPSYSSLEGVLFDKSQATLIKCPGAKAGNYVVPDGVSSIERAFRQCTRLSSVRIPNSVTSIGWYNFSQCSSLTNVTFGTGLVLLGGGAFEGCGSLTAASFEGNAPDLDDLISTDSGAFEIPPFYPPVIIFYRQGTSGWGPEYSRRPTVPWGVVWGSPVRGDVSGNEVVDRNDLDLVVASRNQPAVNVEDPRDLDGDGMITVLDARILVTLFTVPAGFTRVTSSPDGVVLEWNENASGMKLQSTSDIHSETWEDAGGLQSSTNAVIGTWTERMFFRLVLPE